ncbi:hypothetical protein AMATHDRAFT_146177 [Amanita thiersii Skay4041]|uniref:Indoleamine 2,3-dioxygenase n=1 Tax=Amanita thiersii Skay4041 TaxID=703135 RepID=A0A2A9NP49_9AGAR|nr:hypothetical protein AMATHDRAFT_146177 [Amanita thiersii Skay4041]
MSNNSHNNPLGPNHFLSLPRPDVHIGPPAGVPDTTTLAAHDFDVDTRTGFMAPRPPLARLPSQWEAWESTLDDAVASKLQLWDKPGLTEAEKWCSEQWRCHVRRLPVISVDELKEAIELLRRAHLVLTYIQHFYLQSLPPDAPTIIPRPIALPLLRVSTYLNIPPLLTYSDTVLYNWKLRSTSACDDSSNTEATPALDNLQTQTMFTNTIDEEEFYLCSARIELRGVEALEIMRSILDELFISDDIAVRRTTGYLNKLAGVITDLKALLLDVKRLCNPDRYYNAVRPWFRGEDSDLMKRKWVFEGIEEDPMLEEPTELSGPSAGQSSIVHVLDVFLGVDHQSSSPDKPSFMHRMKTYMPYNHRLFLDHLAANPRPLRAFVCSREDGELLDAFNAAVMALKEFRDAHMIIAALYILGPARRAAKMASAATTMQKKAEEDLGRDKKMREPCEPLKGTGGTDLVQFLKDTRTRTMDTVVPPKQN